MLFYVDCETQLVPYHFQLFMPLLAISHGRPSVFLSVCACVCPCVIIYWKFVSTIPYKPLVGISPNLLDKDELIRFWDQKSKDQGHDENSAGKKSLVIKRTFPADAYPLTVRCWGSSSFLNVPFFLLPSKMCHCFEMWLLLNYWLTTLQLKWNTEFWNLQLTRFFVVTFWSLYRLLCASACDMFTKELTLTAIKFKN